jgi:hypothetical protein
LTVTVFEDVPYVYDLDDFIIDTDTPSERLFVTTDSEYISAVGLELYLQYPNLMSLEFVGVAVFDGREYLNFTLDVTIMAVNDPPVLRIPPLSFTEDNPNYINLDLYITDEESTPGELDVTVVSDVLGDLLLYSGHWFAAEYPEGIIEDYYKVTVIDNNLSVFQTVRVTITPENDRPRLLNPGAEPIEEGSSTYNFTVWYADDELRSPWGTEPLLELVLNDQTFSLILLSGSEEDEALRLYGLTLSLTKGSYQYYYQCDDGASAANSQNATYPAILQVEASGAGDDGDDSASTGLDIGNLDSDSNVLLLIIFIVAVIVFAIINVVLNFKRKRKTEEPIAAIRPLLSEPEAQPLPGQTPQAPAPVSVVQPAQAQAQEPMDTPKQDAPAVPAAGPESVPVPAPEPTPQAVPPTPIKPPIPPRPAWTLAAPEAQIVAQPEVEQASPATPDNTQAVTPAPAPEPAPVQPAPDQAVPEPAQEKEVKPTKSEEPEGEGGGTE